MASGASAMLFGFLEGKDHYRACQGRRRGDGRRRLGDRHLKQLREHVDQQTETLREIA
jgi:hypothetical protein